MLFSLRVLCFSIFEQSGRSATNDAHWRHLSSNNAMGREDTSMPHRRSTKHTYLGSDPAIRPDPHWRFDQTLLGNGSPNVVEYMIEIANVHPVRDDPFAPDLDVEVALHGVKASEDSVASDSKSSFVGVDEIAFSEVNPTTDDEASVAFASLERDVFADEHETLSYDMRVSQSEP